MGKINSKTTKEEKGKRKPRGRSHCDSCNRKTQTKPNGNCESCGNPK